MPAQRHSDVVRAFLEYLSSEPELSEALPWGEWARRALGASVVAGLSLGTVGCGGETDDPGQDGVGGSAPVIGGRIGTAYGIPAYGGLPGAVGGYASFPVYGVPMYGGESSTGGTGARGGTGTGGTGARGGTGTGGRVVAAGGNMYGIIRGGSGPIVGGFGGLYAAPRYGGNNSGGVRPTGGSGPIIGGTADLYGIPMYGGHAGSGGGTAGNPPVAGAPSGGMTGGGGVIGGGMAPAYGIPPLGGSAGASAAGNAGAAGAETGGNAGVLGGSVAVLYGTPW